MIKRTATLGVLASIAICGVAQARDRSAASTSDNAWGPDGYLADRGLILLPDAERRAMATVAHTLAGPAM